MYLLDTNALSEVLKKRPEPAFLDRLREHEPKGMATSVVCVFEMRHGCRRHPKGDKLWTRIESEVLSRVTVLPFGMEEAVRAGDIHASLVATGQPIGIEDIWIGATALAHGCTVVTRNTRHLSRIEGLRVVSWWE